MRPDIIEWLNTQLDTDKQDAEARRGIFPSPAVNDDGSVCLHVRPGGNMAITWYRHPAEGWDDMAKLRNWASTAHGWTQERVVLGIDTAPIYDHLREAHTQPAQTVTVRLDNTQARYTPSHPLTPITEPTLTLDSDGLLSKFGFNDGDAPDAWLDYCEANGIDYNEVDFPLVQLVRQYLLPALDQRVTVVEIETIHNPIRAKTVDGIEVHGQDTVNGEPIELTPEQVTIPMAEVARIAQG